MPTPRYLHPSFQEPNLRIHPVRSSSTVTGLYSLRRVLQILQSAVHHQCLILQRKSPSCLRGTHTIVLHRSRMQSSTISVTGHTRRLSKITQLTAVSYTH